MSWKRDIFPLNIKTHLVVANAYFDGFWGINFGSGFVYDDVVAHEWAHGESGAMNEAYSDIYGESVDILNKDTSDSSILRSAPQKCTVTEGGTDTGARWIMGEDTSIGSLRDMYFPECFEDPGMVSSGKFLFE